MQGDSGSTFYIIESGIMHVIINGKVIFLKKIKRELKREDGFGELALLYNSPRSSSVKAFEDCTLWTIDRNKFKRAVEDILLKNYEENRKFMEVCEFYRKYNLSRLNDRCIKGCHRKCDQYS